MTSIDHTRRENEIHDNIRFASARYQTSGTTRDAQAETQESWACREPLGSALT